jgi:signal transduction histidine kinase
VIRGLTEGLQDGVYTQKDVIPQILNESKDMQRLINDLLELSKLEDPDFKVEQVRFEYHDLVTDVVRSAQELVKKKNQKLLVTQDEKTRFGEGDAQRLKQMLLAIIHNATKFSPENSIITLSMGKRKDKVVIAISDEGKGMSSVQVKELFVRYKKETENNPDGNGLGLLIVEKIAQKHGIQIEVDSKLNEGTIFRFVMNETEA